MRVGAVVGLVGAGLLLAGCGSGDVTGEAAPQGVAAGEPVFSPCDDIPDDVLRAAGVDPGTESRDIMGVEQPGWKICKWRGNGPFLTVYSTTYTLDDVRANENNVEFTSVDIGGRGGLQYREVTDWDRKSCDVAIESAGGAVLVSVSDLGGGPRVEDPCALAVQTSRVLVSHIPA
ncbi:DUF3558 domain-containing protein [Prescottella agglutinans]|uniref:DUF3558 domain-containing protein n=1 Tax=Prescottella agglutinans TaxID=1644129 RepID=A0ABT6MB57_9NOCA|nr:DUF3558 domain-containing protein [Prescottella agglutinans]MDH6281537.1 hypothetical protein [Prescottella agglutinans]